MQVLADRHKKGKAVRKKWYERTLKVLVASLTLLRQSSLSTIPSLCLLNKSINIQPLTAPCTSSAAAWSAGSELGDKPENYLVNQ